MTAPSLVSVMLPPSRDIQRQAVLATKLRAMSRPELEAHALFLSRNLDRVTQRCAEYRRSAQDRAEALADAMERLRRAEAERVDMETRREEGGA